MVSQYVG